VTGSGATGFQLILYDASTGRPKAKQLRGAEGLAPALAFSPDGKRLAARGDRIRAVRIWDVATGKDFPTPEGETFADVREVIPVGRSARVRYAEMAFSPDGRHLAVADAQDQLTLFEVASGARLLHFPLDRGQVVHRFRFSPDGRCLATVNQDGTVTLYEAATGRKRGRFGKAVKAPGLAPALMVSAVMIETQSADEIPFALTFSADGRLVAASGPGPEIRLWHLLTGHELATFRGHQGGVTALAFDAAGRRLVSGSMDTTALTWDIIVPARLTPAHGQLARDAVDKIWAELGGDDGEKAFEAVRALCAAPADAVALMRERLRPVKGPDARHVSTLIDGLGSRSFAVRTKATDELEKLGELIVPAARQALERGVALEVRQRLEHILKKNRERPARGEPLATVRGVEVLEHIGTEPARQVLRALAGGAPGSRVTEAAEDALARLGRK
jgi:hypothetical protein